MHLLRKMTYGEFSEFVQEKKIHLMYIYLCNTCVFYSKCIVDILTNIRLKETKKGGETFEAK